MKERSVLINRLSKVMFAAVLSLAMVAGVAIDSAFAFTSGSPFIGNTYNHNARFTNYVVANGVDVSWWQHSNSNWDAAKAAGVDYAIIRATFTSTSNTSTPKMDVDSRFASHYAKAKAAGVMVGAYHFSQARTAAEAAKEAQFIVNRLRALGIAPKDLDLPVYFDYEFNSRLKAKNLNKTIGTAATNAFCNVIRANGYQAGVYASLTFINKYINVNAIPIDVDVWCAQYNSSCGLGYRYSKWQYTSSGKIDGLLGSTGLFKGSIDCNFWYLDPNANLSSGLTVSGGGKSYAYNGTPIRPAITVKNGSKTLKEGTDYKLSYINNVKPGTAYAYVRGIGSYSGYKLVSFSIGGQAVSVPATKIRYIKGKKKSFYVRVAKKSKKKVSGYQVKYSRNKDMSESEVRTIGKKYNKVTKTVKTNARKRYYYVQVRSYKKSNGHKYYSSWSKVKKVKVK